MVRRRCRFALVESTDVNFINLHHISCFCKIAKEFSMKLIANNFDSLSAGRATEQKLIFHFNHKNDPLRIRGSSFLFCFLFRLISLSYRRNNLDYLYDPSERLHTKYYRQINLSPRDISSLFYLFSGVDKSERNFANIFSLIFLFCYNGQIHCKLADWTHTVLSVGKSAFISQKCRGAK